MDVVVWYVVHVFVLTSSRFVLFKITHAALEPERDDQPGLAADEQAAAVHAQQQPGAVPVKGVFLGV